ncbi:hypothetical protein [Bradyrhizobium yuanmingense]|uniref:hypothetical protein n=1 Tax=Bradyrhizobium yuanmingense TaxID=108015 RepID=UPI000AF9957F|nr:hypothetical protein [Bradyrhizobium yuanmingense]
MRNAVREGRLIEIDEAMAIVEQITGLFRAETAGLPARVTRDLQFRKTIETALNDILGRRYCLRKGTCCGIGSRCWRGRRGRRRLDSH